MSAPITTRFVDVGALRFEVFEARPEGPPKGLALCLHGFPEHARAWRHQLPVLAAAGYLAWAPNLRGYGGTSTPPRVADYAIEKLLGDVDGLIDAAGVGPVVLLGHDWGAVISWYYAMHGGRPLDKLVIMNVPHPVPMTRELKVNPLQRKKSWYAAFFQLPTLPEWFLTRRGGEAVKRMFAEGTVRKGAVAPEEVAVFVSNVLRPGGARAMIHYYRALARGGARRMAARGMHLITVPTLMLWGEQDVALAKSTTYGTEDQVATLTLRYLPNASHWVQQDDPETVNTMMAAFLADAPVPHAEGAEGDRDP
jgi:pimeloyl-ACP methyl ester carboxylesterase